MLVILFRPFGFIATETVKIIWLSNLLTFSVPGEGYFRNVSCVLNLISTLLLLLDRGNHILSKNIQNKDVSSQYIHKEDDIV
jgi:hypothetical protein